jgi:hypothetical protein
MHFAKYFWRLICNQDLNFRHKIWGQKIRRRQDIDKIFFWGFSEPGAISEEFLRFLWTRSKAEFEFRGISIGTMKIFTRSSERFCEGLNFHRDLLAGIGRGGWLDTWCTPMEMYLKDSTLGWKSFRVRVIASIQIFWEIRPNFLRHHWERISDHRILNIFSKTACR